MKLDQQVMTRRINWLTSIRDWQSEFVNSLSAREFVDCITDDLLGRGVFVFTPSGQVMRLPKVLPLRPLLSLSPICLSNKRGPVYSSLRCIFKMIKRHRNTAESAEVPCVEQAQCLVPALPGRCLSTYLIPEPPSHNGRLFLGDSLLV